MIGAVFTGCLAALLVTLPPWLQARFPGVCSPAMILGVTGFAMAFGSRSYDGMADLFIHVHSPSTPDSPFRWVKRGLGSLLLSVFGGSVGPEGGAVEICHALAIGARPRGARWFEQRRRTDGAMALASGVSAAFGAPFAGFLLSMELGLGGRGIQVMLASLTAFLAVRLLKLAVGVSLSDFSEAVSGLGFLDLRAWMSALIVGVAAGGACAVLSAFFRYAQDGMLGFFRKSAWRRALCGGALLWLVILAFRPGHLPSQRILEAALGARRRPAEIWLLFSSGTLSLAVVLAGFGTVGVFWPVLALGGLFGCGLGGAFPSWLGASAGLTGWVGASAFWGALLGAPIAGGVLAFELSHQINVLAPCLLAGALARAVRQGLRASPMIQNDLEARGMRLLAGRSAGVLAGIRVGDAMVTDFEEVSELEPVSEIYPRLLKSRYPFLPVVSPQNRFTGLLTVDLIQEAWHTQTAHANSALSTLLTAKDLLYGSHQQTPTLKATDRLSAAAEVFESVPCVAVLDEEGRMAGLLLAHNVRLAYDREVARRSLTIEEGVEEE